MLARRSSPPRRGGAARRAGDGVVQVDLRGLAARFQANPLDGGRRLGEDGRPTAVDPVNDTMSTAGWVDSSSAPAEPDSTSTLSTPGGSPAASAAAPRTSEDSGVSGLGRTITELPASRAGMIFCIAIMNAAL